MRKACLLAAIVAAAVAPASAAITTGNTATWFNPQIDVDGVYTQTVDIEVGAGSNQMLVLAQMNEDAGFTVDSITAKVGGVDVPMTMVDIVDPGTFVCKATLWYLPSPDQGTNTITYTTTDGAKYWADHGLAAIVLNNVAQSAPTIWDASAGSNNTVTTSLTGTPANSLIVSALASGDAADTLTAQSGVVAATEGGGIWLTTEAGGGDISPSYSMETDTNPPLVSVAFAEIPEPTTMALLGLGGLAVLRRRKK
jgi:hypothetical protein